MFCIKCGEEAVEGQVFCEKHFLESKELFDIDDFTIKMCDCGRYKSGKGWKRKEKNKESIVKQEIKKRMVSKYNIPLVISLDKKGDGYKATITGKGKIPPAKKPKQEKKIIRVRIKKILCPLCRKRKGKYYEAVIQVRGDKKEDIMDELEKLLKREDISRIEETKNGYDILLIDKSKASSVSQTLKKRYNVKESFKLIGVKKDRKLYRNYYSVR